MVGSPLKLSGTPTTPRGLAPDLGAHTDDVLRLVCGLDDEQLGELRAGGTI
jgi:CoA:oxalate CoA-transferase